MAQIAAELVRGRQRHGPLWLVSRSGGRASGSCQWSGSVSASRATLSPYTISG
jgi:hypothetical protein